MHQRKVGSPRVRLRILDGISETIGTPVNQKINHQTQSPARLAGRKWLEKRADAGVLCRNSP
jgi:hypothetical protein